MVWIDGNFSSDERDLLEKLMHNFAISDRDRIRIRAAIEERRSFEDVWNSGLLQEKNPQKAKIKNRLLLVTAYELAKADGAISENETTLHNRMAKFMNIREEEVCEIRRLVLLKSGVDIRDRIEIVKGNLIEQSVDAVVNSTNKTLLPGNKFSSTPWLKDNRKIDATIHRLAGSSLWKECKEIGNCDVGFAKITQGYNLPNQWLIHTVTPIWTEGSWKEQELLRRCYHNSLMTAHQRPIRSIVFISALIGSTGPNRELIRRCLKQEYQPLMGNTLFCEYESVIKRSEILDKCSLTEQEISVLLRSFMSISQWVNIYYLWRPNLRDEADNHLIELAIAGNAQIIATNNLKDLKNAELLFPDLSILKPEEIIRS